MKRLLSLLALATFSLAAAHDLARDGAVGGMLHLEPDDEPLAGKPSALVIDLRRRGGQAVTLAQCSCTLKLAGPGGTLNVPLSGGFGPLKSTLNFKTAGAYTLTLHGHLNTRPFTLHWVLRAEAN